MELTQRSFAWTWSCLIDALISSPTHQVTQAACIEAACTFGTHRRCRDGHLKQVAENAVREKVCRLLMHAH
eukprot:1158130-Pelagomonas_calceolata.AAC.9